MSQTAEQKHKSSRNRGVSVCRDCSIKQHVITVEEHQAGGKIISFQYQPIKDPLRNDKRLTRMRILALRTRYECKSVVVERIGIRVFRPIYYAECSFVTNA